MAGRGFGTNLTELIQVAVSEELNLHCFRTQKQLAYSGQSQQQQHVRYVHIIAA